MAAAEDKAISDLKSRLITLSDNLQTTLECIEETSEELQLLKAFREHQNVSVDENSMVTESSIAADDDLKQITDVMTEMRQNLLNVEDGLERTEIIVKRLDQHSALEAVINTKLSDASKSAIETSKGPLKPEDLKKFLMDVVFAKNKRLVLPNIRRYTPLVEKLMIQLNMVTENNQAHERYVKEQRKLDQELNRKIHTLVENVTRELEREASQKRSQPSMDMYTTRPNQ